MTDKPLMTEREAAEMLRVTLATLARWRRTRGLPGISVTRRKVLYEREALMKWLESFKPE